MALSELKFIKLRIIFRAEESGRLPPFLGSTVRGILGHSMRNLVCVAPNVKCHLCEYVTDCDYATYFNPPGSFAGSIKPYVIHVPIRDKVNWYKGDLLSFDLTFFGKSTTAIDYYMAGILGMEKYGWGAQRLKFSLQQVVNISDQSLVWSGGETWWHHMKAFSINDEGRFTNSVLLRFTSPTRIVVKQNLVKQLEFKHIIRSIMTRIKLLLHGYAGVVLEWDEEKLLTDAQAIKTVEEAWEFEDFKRYSRTYNRQLRLPSIMGYARYEGDITPFTPLLEIGQLLQIGKNTTHGFGHYDLYYG